jgi:hypothetical protein
MPRDLYCDKNEEVLYERSVPVYSQNLVQNVISCIYCDIEFTFYITKVLINTAIYVHLRLVNVKFDEETSILLIAQIFLIHEIRLRETCLMNMLLLFLRLDNKEQLMVLL